MLPGTLAPSYVRLYYGLVLKKQNFSNTLNTLSMASPFSLEEKQALLETKDLSTRKLRLEQILKTYTLDDFSNKTLQ